MRFWFRKRNKPSAAAAAGAGAGSADTTTDGGNASPATGSEARSAGARTTPPGGGAAAAKPQTSTLSTMSGRLLDQAAATRPQTNALNDQIVQAVQLGNSENTAYAPAQIAIGPNMMISQASGLIAQSSAAYFDGVSKLALASQSILLKQMTENLVENNLEAAAEDALGVLATDILLGAAAAVAAAAGALEAESASFAIDKIDQSIAKYSDVMRSRKPAVN